MPVQLDALGASVLTVACDLHDMGGVTFDSIRGFSVDGRYGSDGRSIKKYCANSEELYGVFLTALNRRIELECSEAGLSDLLPNRMHSIMGTQDGDAESLKKVSSSGSVLEQRYRHC